MASVENLESHHSPEWQDQFASENCCRPLIRELKTRGWAPLGQWKNMVDRALTNEFEGRVLVLDRLIDLCGDKYQGIHHMPY
jgi:hypothetical protein